MLLSELKPEASAIVKSVNGGYGFRKRMLQRGIVEGSRVRVLSRCGPITVNIDEQNTITLGRGMASKIEVTEPA